MAKKKTRNRGYGNAIADAVLAAVNDPNFVPESTRSWFDDWIEPGPRRDGFRRWLTNWLTTALVEIPIDDIVRYLTEMARDLERQGVDPAVKAFIDKILPEIISNGDPED